MGRHKEPRDEDKIEDQKSRWWGEERNKRRRERYHSDPNYREQRRQQARESYRRRNSARVDEDCRENLGRLKEVGEYRTVQLAPGAEEQVLLTFNTKELAGLLNRNTNILYRWQSSGVLPKPVVPNRDFGGIPVFTEPEVRALMEVFGNHQQVTQYLRAKDKTTIRAFYDALAKVRQKHGIMEADKAA